MGLAYFGSVGLHEAGHMFTAYGVGARSVDVDMFPIRDDEGRFHLANTHAVFNWEPSARKLTLFNVMGPTATFVGHVGVRELLKTRTVPKILQPTLAWFGLFNRVSYYVHAITGLTRMEGQDLAKEKVWIAGVMLTGVIAYDLFDFLTEDKPENQYLVLFGEYFYRPEKEKAALRLISQPRKGGGFLGLGLEW